MRESTVENFELLRENAELRGVLWEQWEANHFEHCGRDWPHPEGKSCYWPLPEILQLNSSEVVVG